MISVVFVWFTFVFFKKKTAYEVRISDWSSDVCSSDLDAWLASDGDDLTWALGFLRSVAPLAPHEVAALIDDFLERRPDRVRDVFGTLRFIDPKADARPLADSLIAALNRSAPEDWENGGNDWDDYYASWIKFAQIGRAHV